MGKGVQEGFGMGGCLSGVLAEGMGVYVRYCCLDQIEKRTFFTMRVVKRWHRKVVEAPSLETFKDKLNRARFS